jgi:hypothetical protein
MRMTNTKQIQAFADRARSGRPLIRALDDFAEAKRGKATQQFAEGISAYCRMARF